MEEKNGHEHEAVIEALLQVKHQLLISKRLLQRIYMASGFHEKPKPIEPTTIPHEREGVRSLLDDTGLLLIGASNNMARLLLILEKNSDLLKELEVDLKDGETAQGIYNAAAALLVREKVAG